MWTDLERGLFMVADGMGGMRDGGRAAEIAIDTVPAVLPEQTAHLRADEFEPLLDGAVRRADEAVRSELGEHRQGGTTLVVAWGAGAGLHLAHAGDSRALLVRAGAVEVLTVDHNLAALYVESGRITAAEARGHPAASRLTSYVGMGRELTVEYRFVDVEPGDRIVLATDGLTGMVEDDDVLATVAAGADVAAVTDALVAMANDAGGLDNIGVVLLEVG